VLERDTEPMGEYTLYEYLSKVLYQFKYEHFPSHKEYKSGNYEITAINISGAGEYEISIPWDEIR